MNTAVDDLVRAHLSEAELELLDLGARRAGAPTATGAERRQAATARDALLELAAHRGGAAEQDGPAGPRPLDEVRTILRRELDVAVDNLGKVGVSAALASPGLVASLASAYRDLGGDLELDGDPLERIRPLLEAATDVQAAASTLTPDEFPPRLEHLVNPLRRLGDSLEGLR